MNYRDLLNSGANVSVTLKLEDLREIFGEMTGGLKSKPKDLPVEDLLSRKEVLNLLKIDSSTFMELGENRLYQIVSFWRTKTI